MTATTMISKDMLMEEVCEGCPATCWGKRTHCQVHDQHIGKVESCPEWERYLLQQQNKPQPPVKQEASKKRESLSDWNELAPALSILQKTEEEIRDYSYMQIEIVRIQRYLREAGEGMVSQYGLDSAMPKGQGFHSDKTHAEAVRRERKQKRLKSLQDKIDRINRAVETIRSEQERLIVEALLDGEKNNGIAKALGVSRQRYYEIKRSAVMKMAWAMYEDEMQQTG
ncbi:hypothetical protein P9302_03250 [Brevibacillus agri]|nr:hypothetical protein [Brevibacillus agri]MED4568497.1 hypothetical protein [Brevibacillus agri]WHX30112.1 hypothetical protein QNK09_24155 [Brevibacillus agri]